jgi:hypothetical protein
MSGLQADSLTLASEFIQGAAAVSNTLMGYRKAVEKAIGVLGLVILGCWQASGRGQGIYSNGINDPNPSTANPFNGGDVLDPNLTATGVGRGSGITANAGSNRYNAANWSLTSPDASDYFTWTITPAAGYRIDFTSLGGMWQRSSTGPKNYILESSHDNFATPIASDAITGSGSASAYSIGLSSLQDVDSAIEFRLLAYGGTGASGTFSINDFEFDGVVEQIGGGTPTLAGDYNGNGAVDAADYVTWRASATDGSSLANETASLGVTDQADYDAWRANFGAATASGGTGLSGGAAVVPEPSALMLLAVALVVLCIRSLEKPTGRGCRLQTAT